LRDTLHEIVERWRRIVPDSALLPAGTGLAERRTPGFASTPPGNLHVMALRDVRTTATAPGDLRSPLEVTYAWASGVRSWRLIAPTTSATVDTEVVTLLFHLDWIVREFPSETLAQFAQELTDVRAQLRAVTDERAPPVVGHCTATVDERRCGAPLRLPEGGTSIRCPMCGAQYDGYKLVRLHQAQEEESTT
jgi:LSD1 subclass zinc finger protein